MIFYHHTDPSYLPSIFEKGLLARPWHAGEGLADPIKRQGGCDGRTAAYRT
jgi:hypothetical protein